jgi:hypothetical protein
MSRGLGKLQQSLLAELAQTADGHASVLDLLESIDGVVTQARYSAGRRAMRGLLARGLVGELPFRYRVYWGNDISPSAQKHFALSCDAERLLKRDVAQLIEGMKRLNVAK